VIGEMETSGGFRAFTYKRNSVRKVFSQPYTDILNLLRKETGQCCGIRLYVETNNEVAQLVYYKLGLEKTHYYLLEKDFRNTSQIKKAIQNGWLFCIN
jgi:hypothetical protein